MNWCRFINKEPSFEADTLLLSCTCHSRQKTFYVKQCNMWTLVRLQWWLVVRVRAFRHWQQHVQSLQTGSGGLEGMKERELCPGMRRHTRLWRPGSWYTPLISGLKKPRQEEWQPRSHSKWQASKGHITRSVSKITKQPKSSNKFKGPWRHV